MADPPHITLLTDFGTADGYVAAMKGVIATITPDAHVADATHDIPPGDVHAAAWVLAGYWRIYPRRTVHVVVVDPGVGSDRRALAAEADGRLLVAPDNGVLTRAFAEAAASHIVTITNAKFLRDVVAATFHGRDVFAPAAAHLARGHRLDELGPVIDDPVRLNLPEPQRHDDAIDGEIIHVDRYGNLVTNIPASWLAGRPLVRVAGLELPLQRIYTDVDAGQPLALIGSRDVMEISVRDGNAADVLGVRRGEGVRVSTSR